ncbi:MAG: FadR/GntR family transcriptional regulator [Pyramidobacter sp.]|jgi:GntR family transcriptional repressor for pyruvate dehydrogenase complex
MKDQRQKSLKYYEIILEWFKQQLATGALKEGDSIPSERDLAAQFGVSRVPVREALRILEYIGIVTDSSDGMIIQHIDAHIMAPKLNFASEITRETMANLFEVRVFLESSAAYYAALRRTDEDLKGLKESIDLMADACLNRFQSDEKVIQASHEFHFKVIQAVKNPVLENIYHNLYDLLEISKSYTLNVADNLDATLMEHEAIYYKIRDREADMASKYMQLHLMHAKKKLLQQK